MTGALAVARRGLGWHRHLDQRDAARQRLLHGGDQVGVDEHRSRARVRKGRARARRPRECQLTGTGDRAHLRARGAERRGTRARCGARSRRALQVLDPGVAERGGDRGGLCRQLIVRDLTLTEPHHHDGRSIACVDSSLNPALDDVRVLPPVWSVGRGGVPAPHRVRPLRLRRLLQPQAGRRRRSRSTRADG